MFKILKERNSKSCERKVSSNVFRSEPDGKKLLRRSISQKCEPIKSNTLIITPPNPQDSNSTNTLNLADYIHTLNFADYIEN